MNIEEFRDYCLSKKGTIEDTPFGPDTLVLKVMGKVFSLTGLNELEFKVNLKCEPNYAIELREKYDFIVPGFHMNKAHWNTISMEKASNLLSKTLINHSYEQVVQKFSRKEKAEFESLIS